MMQMATSIYLQQQEGAAALWHLSPRPFAFALFLLAVDSSRGPALNTLPNLG